jgi:hypothetical protein
LAEIKDLDKNILIEELDRLLDWIKSCDTKASIVLAVVGIFVAGFTSEHSIKMLNTIISTSINNISFSNLLYLLLTAASWFIFVYGAYNLIRVLVPRLKKSVMVYEGTNQKSLYYFETISDRTFLEYKEQKMDRSAEEDIDDILSQIFINAKVSTKKYSFYHKGILYAFTGMAGTLILYIIGILLVKLGGF